MKMFQRLAGLAVGMTMIGLAASAADLPEPKGAVILTIGGNIEVTNADGTAQFDLEMLRELGSVEFRTSTIWTDGDQVFEGVWLSTLLETLGADGVSIAATAINDYSVEIPLTDAIEGGALVAYYRNGEPMPVRDKGPLWVVYPFDDNPGYKSEVTYSRSIWQLDRMTVQTE